jgi:hypothetical protein
MTELEKVKKSLGYVFDYVNSQNSGVCQQKAINELNHAIAKVKKLPIHDVIGSFWSDNAITRLKAEYFEKGLNGK